MHTRFRSATGSPAQRESHRVDPAVWQGARAMIPWLAVVAPLGLVVGTTNAANELPVALALVSGALIFNGPAQLASIELIGAGAGVGVVVTTVLMMSVHLLILGSSMAPHWRGTSTRFRLLASATLIDPTFIEGDRRYRSGGGGGHAFYLGAAAALAVVWHATVVIGAFAGAMVPPSARIEWILPLFVLAELVQRLRTPAVIAAGAVGGGVACLTHALPMNGGVLLAILSAAAVGLTMERRAS